MSCPSMWTNGGRRERERERKWAITSRGRDRGNQIQNHGSIPTNIQNNPASQMISFHHSRTYIYTKIFEIHHHHTLTSPPPPPPPPYLLSLSLSLCLSFSLIIYENEDQIIVLVHCTSVVQMIRCVLQSCYSLYTHACILFFELFA